MSPLKIYLEFFSIIALIIQKVKNMSKEFLNVKAIGSLNSTKIFALLDLPPDQGDDFIAQTHEIKWKTKTVDEK